MPLCSSKRLGFLPQPHKLCYGTVADCPCTDSVVAAGRAGTLALSVGMTGERGGISAMSAASASSWKDLHQR